MQIFEYQPTKLHSKMLVMDDVVHIGSSNFDLRSLYLNMEMMLRVDDPEFAQMMRNYFEHELCNSLEITPTVYKAAGDLAAAPQVADRLVPGGDARLHRDPAPSPASPLSPSRHAQNKVAGGTLIHSKPRSIFSKCGLMKSSTLGLN